MVYASRTLKVTMAAGIALSLQACGAKAPVSSTPAPAAYAEAILYDGTGKRTGIVTLRPHGDHMQGQIDIMSGLTGGQHGMHIHTVGQCTLPDFASAGGHLNPGGKEHGLENPRGSHEGDLPMLVGKANGTASQSFMAHTTLDALFDADGSAFVVHAQPDDMKTDPTGNSGARIMCGVLYRKAP